MYCPIGSGINAEPKPRSRTPTSSATPPSDPAKLKQAIGNAVGFEEEEWLADVGNLIEKRQINDLICWSFSPTPDRHLMISKVLSGHFAGPMN